MAFGNVFRFETGRGSSGRRASGVIATGLYKERGESKCP
jgi:hypothetical protein